MYQGVQIMKKIIVFILVTMIVVNVLGFELAHIDNNFLSAPTGEMVLIEVTFEIPEGQYAALQEEFFGIDIEDSPGIRVGKTIYPEGAIATDYGFSKYMGTITLMKELFIDRNAQQGERELELVLFYQLCLEDGTCFIPEEEFHSLNLYVVQGANQRTTGLMELPESGSKVLKFLLLAFIGGIILNLMPCVLPILSIRAFNIVKQSNNSPKNIFINSVLYILGIMFSFFILATVITIIKLSGEMVGWGFQFQNPKFVLFLLSLMFVFSLSLFDVFTVQVPGLTAATKASSKSGYLGSFLMGVFCVLLATPCTAPILGGALGFAFAQPPIIIYAIFLLVGFGLGFPFLILGLYPQAIKILPKPGEWMVVFKEILGFLLLAFAISMVKVLLIQMGGLYVISVLYFMLFLGIAVWLYGKFVTPMYPRLTQWIITIVAVLVVIFGAMLTVKGQEATDFNSGITHDDFWSVFSEEAVEAGLADGRLVFVEFTAAYCTICKQNAALVLNQNDIRQAFTDNNVLMLLGDFTRSDPVIYEWLRRYDRAGVPLYLLFVPGQDEPIRFPEILTKQMIFNQLRNEPSH